MQHVGRKKLDNGRLHRTLQCIQTWYNTVHKLNNQELECEMFLVLRQKRQLNYINFLLQSVITTNVRSLGIGTLFYSNLSPLHLRGSAFENTVIDNAHFTEFSF